MTFDDSMPIVPETPTTACVEADSPRTMRSGHGHSEKIGFGVAEHMLAAVGRTLTGRLVAHGGEIVEAQATGAVAKARKLLAAARRRLTRGKVRATPAEVAAAPHALLLPAQWCLFSAWRATAFGCAAFSSGHTHISFVGAACDSLDCLAHVLVLPCLLLDGGRL
ncbi:hypothetical protein EMIHUDRAFT_230371 [Emiliania huxleyi CCMP1516]|uniref:Senescence domain-containing protein n=2 Tax=Emiliania huxleyi TaxID=2903 RepID=A0A0D3KAJ8_EMIH1|nr:hypothetical protein EMIHUDRAFT_230371 [Emiliania huxleyi CCMP1516]EOD32783.1 hypothetical protein EMIHUDRAFT_230371 [Emiliania huxleyi CCMP1516]|eukprot:XP_005785212.1 hypothetical protein EMIHUDRAFT_230371 [Emiliania huxleyi CCMP1516]